MQHLNYCRQMVKQFTEQAGIPSVRPDVKQFKSHCIDLARASQKFILPDGGRLYEDPDFRALDESIPLRLPFPLIAIEFTRSPEYLGSVKFLNAEKHQPRKALLFAREREDCIAVTVVVWAEHMGVWAPYPEIAIPLTGYINRDVRQHGYAAIRAQRNSAAWIDVPLADYGDEVGALMSMLNVLSCKNVHIEKSEVGATRKAMSGGKAIPFDSYHVLTVDVPHAAVGTGKSHGHRSPREHLRRGHIRRYDTGVKVWVNATVVNAGVGGKVAKDYRLAA